MSFERSIIPNKSYQMVNKKKKICTKNLSTLSYCFFLHSPAILWFYFLSVKPENMIASSLLFYVLSTVLLSAAVLVVTARNMVHSVLFLILASLNASGLFILMHAEFLAMILVIVYVGFRHYF